MTWKKGQSGNPKGRPPKPEIAELRKAIAKVERQEKKKLLEHYVKQAFKDNIVLAHLISRLIPGLKTVDANVDMVGELIVKCLRPQPKPESKK